MANDLIDIQTAFTPGPWAFTTRYPLDSRVAEWTRVYSTARTYGDVFTSPKIDEFRRQQYLHLCEVFFLNGGPAQEANARLIAASPELLEACIHAAIFIEALSEKAKTKPQVVDMLRAAIGKATNNL